jgi:hypothetical protein
MDAPLPREIRQQLLRFEARYLSTLSKIAKASVQPPVLTICAALCPQNALRNLEVALEPALKLTGKELDEQARRSIAP